MNSRAHSAVPNCARQYNPRAKEKRNVFGNKREFQGKGESQQGATDVTQLSHYCLQRPHPSALLTVSNWSTHCQLCCAAPSPSPTPPPASSPWAGTRGPRGLKVPTQGTPALRRFASSNTSSVNGPVHREPSSTSFQVCE